MAFMASSGLEKHTNPKPLLIPLSVRIILVEVTAPQLLKHSVEYHQHYHGCFYNIDLKPELIGKYIN